MGDGNLEHKAIRAPCAGVQFSSKLIKPSMVIGRLLFSFLFLSAKQREGRR